MDVIYARWEIDFNRGFNTGYFVKNSDLPKSKDFESIAKKFKIESDLSSYTSDMNWMLNKKASPCYETFYRIGPWRYSGDKDWLINTKTLKWYHNEYDWETWQQYLNR